MVFAAPMRSMRSAAVALAVAVVTSMLVTVTAPAVAATTQDASDAGPFHPGVADRLPLALIAAESVGSPTPGEGTASITGTITFPDGVDLDRGRTVVVAYAAGADALSPLAATAVGADGSYALEAPIGDIAIAVLSEGRAVFDDGGPLGSDSPELLSLGVQGLVHDVALDRSALVSGTVTAPAGVGTGGRSVVVAIYPATGDGIAAEAANYVTDAGTFAVGGLPAGEYRVAFVSAASGAVSEWWENAPAFTTATSLSLEAGQSRTGIDAALEALRLMETSVPVITGTPTVGQTLKAAPGTWTAGTTLTYQWFANGVAIPKATASTLLVSTAVAGKRLTVAVTGKKASYRTTTVSSAATTAVVRPLAAPVPAITGTATVGQTLKVKPGTWTAGTRLTYQWYINGVAVAKATGTSFTIPAAAAVKTITVVVTGSKAGYATAARRSKATASVKGILTAPVPRITGSAVVGSRLTAVPSPWTSGTKLTYQWYRNGKAISGARASTLVVTAALAKGTITVRVTGTKSGFITAARTSARTGVVTYPARTKPISTWNCPAWAPIKGNASSMIYHVPRGAYYNKTKPEACFSSESAAVKAGYRKSKR